MAAGCDCRKPKPGMFRELARLYDVALSASTHVGDSGKDRDAAMAAGVGTFVWARDFLRLGHRARPVVGSLYTSSVDLASAPSAQESHTRTVVPRPGSLSIRKSPLCANTRCLTIASPSPVPPSSRDRALSTR
jgi:HAD-hyrolase-like protein